MEIHFQEKRNSTPVDSEVTRKNSAQLIDVPAKEARTKTVGSSVRRANSSRSQKKSAPLVPPTKVNKREFVERLLKKDANIVWPREMRVVNSLFKMYPNDDFWLSFDLTFKLNSLCWLLSDDGRKTLNLEYKKFNFEPQKPQNFKLEDNDNNIAFNPKIDDTVKVPITVREFLTLWRKKK